MPTDSDIEDLPTEHHPSRIPWEWIAGGLVLAIVVGVAVGGWWQSAQAAQAYRQGVAAAVAHHWAAAATAFHTAGAWQDAPAQAAHADAQVQQLGALSAQGQAATARADWLAATQAFSAAAEIEADYQDVSARAAQAGQELRRTGLAGTVALITAGAQPGLYIEPDGRYLPGSDADSRVRAIAPDGHRFIYDQGPPPLPGGKPAPAPTPPRDFWIPARDPAQVRPAVLVALDAAGTPACMGLPPAIDGHGLGVFLGDVLWWFAPRNDLGYYSYAVTYYDLRTGEHGLIAGPDGRVQPVAWQPDGAQVALAEFESVPAGAEPRARLYLTDAHGGHRVFLSEVSGTLGPAAFSADGHYLFFRTTGKGSTRHTLALADLRSLPGRQSPPEIRPIEGLSAPGGISAGLTAAWLGSRADLLVDTWIGADERLALYRPAVRDSPEGVSGTGSWVNLWQGPAHPDIPDLAAVAPDGQTLAWRYRPAAGPDRLIVLTPGGQTRETPLAQDADRSLELAFSPHGDYLLYGGYRLDGSAGGRLTPVFSLPVRGTGVAARLGERVWDAQLPTLALPAAGTLVAIVNPQHELHAVSYDGRTDLLVAQGVAAVWNLRAVPFSGWIH